MSPDAALERDLADLVATEAALLDAARWDDWLALWAEDGRYWVPLLGARQVDGSGHNALADDDRLLLALRVERLKHPRAHSLHPTVSGQHVLQRSRVETATAHAAELHTPFVYIESQAEREVMLAGSYRHRLVRREAGRWQIREKRVDLLNSERPLPAIQLFV